MTETMRNIHRDMAAYAAARTAEPKSDNRSEQMKQPPAPQTSTTTEPAPKPPLQITMRVAEKGGLSVYGLQRMPITLYAEQWIHLSDLMPEIREFIELNRSKLAWKDAK